MVGSPLSGQVCVGFSNSHCTGIDRSISGSSLHSMKVFANPRWEDFEYCYVNDNVFGWLGDGWTENEKHNNINVDYLDDNMVDFPRPMNIAK